jgi:hypothetical protein
MDEKKARDLVTMIQTVADNEAYFMGLCVGVDVLRSTTARGGKVVCRERVAVYHCDEHPYHSRKELAECHRRIQNAVGLIGLKRPSGVTADSTGTRTYWIVGGKSS